MTYDIVKETWDKLKEKFGGSSKTRTMQLLRMEFELLRIQDI
uniref:Uncharacterized protein LOC105640964 n=1 Tax=Rhizophora mucronata TaxID=61149 RepID=A0A2P2MWQ3_RHIMU